MAFAGREASSVKQALWQRSTLGRAMHKNAARQGSARAQLSCAPRSGRQRKRPKGKPVQQQRVQLHTRPADPLCCGPRPSTAALRSYVLLQISQPKAQVVCLYRRAVHALPPGPGTGVSPTYSNFSVVRQGRPWQPWPVILLILRNLSMTGPTPYVCTPCDLSEQGAPRTVWTNGAPPGSRCRAERLLPSRRVHVQRECPGNGCVGKACIDTLRLLHLPRELQSRGAISALRPTLRQG